MFKDVHINGEWVCEVCKGKGKTRGFNLRLRNCHACNGKGQTGVKLSPPKPETKSPFIKC